MLGFGGRYLAERGEGCASHLGGQVAKQLCAGVLATRLGENIFANAALLVASGAMDNHSGSMLDRASGMLANEIVPFCVRWFGGGPGLENPHRQHHEW